MKKKDKLCSLDLAYDHCKNCESLVLLKDIPKDSKALISTYDREKGCTSECLTPKILDQKTLLH